LAEIHLDQGVAAEDIDEHLQLHVVGVDLGNLTLEVGERAFLYAHCFAHLVVEFWGLALGLHFAFFFGSKEVLHFLLGKRCRALTALVLADETRDAWRLAHTQPGVVVKFAAHEDVAGEHLFLNGLLATVLELDHVLHRDDDLVHLVLEVHRLHAGAHRLLCLFFVARLTVYNVPLARS